MHIVHYWGEKYMHYVYLLPHKSLPYFKIGITNDFARRFNEIQPGLYGLAVSSTQALRLRSQDAAIKVEKILHLTFGKWSLGGIESFNLGLPSNGSSEWFCQSCYGNVCEFIEYLAQFIEFEHVTSFEVVQQIESSVLRRKRTPSKSQFEKLMDTAKAMSNTSASSSA